MNKAQEKLYEKLLKKVNEYCLGAAAEDVIAAIDALVDTYENRITFVFGSRGNSKTTMLINVYKAFKAIEIIKEKCPFFNLYSDEEGMCPKGHYRIYDNELYQFNELTKEEYEVLKEVFDCE